MRILKRTSRSRTNRPGKYNFALDLLKCVFNVTLKITFKIKKNKITKHTCYNINKIFKRACFKLKHFRNDAQVSYIWMRSTNLLFL